MIAVVDAQRGTVDLAEIQSLFLSLLLNCCLILD